MTTDHDPLTGLSNALDEESAWQSLAAARRAKLDELRAAARCVTWRDIINASPPEELRAIVRDVFASLLDEDERGGLTYMGVDVLRSLVEALLEAELLGEPCGHRPGGRRRLVVRWRSLDRIENEILAAHDRLHGGPR